MKSIAIFFIRCYKRLLSPLLSPRCRFEPTCSAYAIEAIRKKGLLVGSFKAAWRILRCNPWSRGGYDPVDPPPVDNSGESPPTMP
ncbi:membrane protein insertion efficiency factor YidD [bacterium]|nr:membrane protein insertion efficiency factor YidD [bacterium]